MQAKANKLAKVGAQVIYIGDEERETLTKYIAHFEPELNQTILIKESVESAKVKIFNDALLERQNLLSYLRSGYGGLPAGIAGSAYDLVGANYRISALNTWFRNNQMLTAHLGNYVLGITGGIGKFVNVNLTFDIHTADGSIAIMRVTGFLTFDDVVNAKLDLELIQVVDPDGNILDLTKKEPFKDVFLIRDGDLEKTTTLVNAAHRLGFYAVRVSSFRVSSGGSVTINDGLICEKVGDKVVCKVPTNPK
ncbi:hypothetical protein KKI34_09000 [Pseudoalteromonas tetraodonis]|uniref:hypothetical protein n=1 Tax=Pseudoalteromonas tetraodonis TaxID=43659 RepID=UPI001BDDE3A3|nr:hypothetical protein [Pseudoalteromonas tetraodonis]MBT2151941.1 hypothetical protein [Pseudoalteromonas tetraodonis]